jgi:MYXO-CTERM domain-containing protein
VARGVWGQGRVGGIVAGAASMLVLTLGEGVAFGQSTLEVGQATVDPPTVVSLGVQLLVTGDDDFDATVSVRYREPAGSWRDGLPLFRVHPEDSPELAIPAQFAGSIVELQPATTYEIELHAVDPDGTDQTLTVSGTTRPVPAAEPAAAVQVSVADAVALQTALDGAQPGHVILLADGVYAGNFALNASGTSDNPIVIRGTSRDGTILDGGGCQGCNVLEVYGSYVHLEGLTLRNASRALRFQGDGAQGNVVRRVHISDVTLGIGARQNQKDFYVCDNLLEGRLVWPAVYSDDGGAHANDDGINLQGEGHVVCHNELVGFGDGFKLEQDAMRSIDFYGNEVRSAYDNGVEFDGALRNMRVFGNRFTNAYSPLSFQPVHGGPVYAFRNVVVNVVDEQLKFHGLGTLPAQEPNGVLVLHNTFVSPRIALTVQTTATSHHFVLENNIFVGPSPPQTRVVDWGGIIDQGTFDYNGYSPDGPFTFHPPAGYQNFASFAEAQAAGWEPNGLILAGGIFESGLAPPVDYLTALSPADATLASGSPALDRGLVLPNFNDAFQGAAPDLGALERGCPAPAYGIRPEGVDESNEPGPCGSGGTGGAGGTGAGGSGSGANGAGGLGGQGQGASGTGANSGADGATDEEGGCGCRTVPRQSPAGWAPWALPALVALGARRRRRASRDALRPNQD